MINPINDYITAHHSTKLLLATGGLCAIAATEMAVRTLANVGQLFQPNSKEEKAKISHNISRNFFGAMLFGMFASNAIPYLSVIGTLIFVGNAFSNNNDDALYTTQALRVFKPLAEQIGGLAGDVLEGVGKILWNVASRIGNIIYSIFETIGNILSPIVSFLGNALYTIIPKTAEAYAFIFVLAAIGIYKFYS